MWSAPVPRKAISANNVMEMNHTTLALCQAQCEQLVYCKSIDWKPHLNRCSLNAENDKDGTLKKFNKFVWYRKDCEPGNVRLRSNVQTPHWAGRWLHNYGGAYYQSLLPHFLLSIGSLIYTVDCMRRYLLSKFAPSFPSVNR